MLPPNSYTGECIHIPIALCIQAYNQCNPEKKKGLIAKYKAEGGIKNLAWVTNYVEKAKDLEVTETKITRGYFYASEILRMNGFQQGTLDQKTEQKVLEGLLADCYQEFQVDPSNPPQELKQENKKVPHLTKYWYQKSTNTSSEQNIKEAAMEMKLDCQSNNLKSALEASSGSSSGIVKVENPKFLEMKQEMAITQSMKTNMEKVLAATETLHKDLVAENKAEAKDLLNKMLPVLTEAGQFLDNVRKLLAECKSFDTSTDIKKIEPKITELKAGASAGAHHIDGLKAISKRLKAIQ